MSESNFQVAIVGAGPVGLTLANLLGVYGIRTVVLERNATTVEEPRAIACDAESLRTYQAAGLYDDVASEMLLGFDVDYVNSAGKVLFSPDIGPTPYGHALQNSFDQPVLERQILQGLERFAHCEVRFGHLVEHLEQRLDAVSVSGTTEGGERFDITARYVIGCDGGRSHVRQHLGVEMQGTTAPQRWLVVDTVDPYLDDAFACRFFCDPDRPGMTLKKRHAKRRWEWMLLPGEQDGDLLEEDKIHELLARYTKPEQVTIERKCVYTFHSIVADRYRDGRILIAGDAAHMMPPFAGQGMNGGVRDARNLAWKLALVLGGGADDELLDTYEIERRDHIIEATRIANRLGDLIQPTSHWRAWVRDAVFLGIQLVPGLQRTLDSWMLATLRAPRLPAGMFVPTDASSGIAGEMIPQPDVTLLNGDTCRLDELLGTGFVILGIGSDPATELPETVRSAWRALDARFVHIVRDRPAPSADAGVDTGGGLFAWAGDSAECFLAIRPDKFVIARFSAANAVEVTKQAIDLLKLGRE